MAQKTHPVSIRLNGVTPWKSLWYVSKNNKANEFIKQWSSSCYIERFYKKSGFDLLHFRQEKTNFGSIYFIALRKITNKTDIYPRRFSNTLPLGIKSVKQKFVNKYYEEQNNLSINITNNLFSYPEINNLLPGLLKINGMTGIIIKSHPSFYNNCSIPAEYLAIFIRDQLLRAVKRKRRLIPLRYFRNIAMYLREKLNNQLIGIKFQIKGRLPRLGSSGAARSKHQIFSAGQLSLQRISSFLDYSYVDLRTKSGLSSIRVWISYNSPLIFNNFFIEKVDNKKINENLILNSNNSVNNLIKLIKNYKQF